MSILLTGWEGTVGSHLLKYLKNKDYEVTTFEGDICEWDNWIKYVDRKWDGLIHLAAIPGVRRSFEEPEFYYKNNVEGTANAIEFADTVCNKMLYASSSNSYEWWGNPYAATKRMNELQAKGHRAVGMRFHTVWPGRPDMLFQKLVNDEVTYINENHYRDWIHVDDLCEAICTIYENFDIILKSDPVIDIGTGHSTPVAEVARVMGFDGEYRKVDPAGERKKTQANVEPLLKLGWTPKRNILNEARNFK